MISDSENPYAPPLHDARPAEEAILDYPLATRAQRFGGALIDGVLLGLGNYLLLSLFQKWNLTSRIELQWLTYGTSLLGTLIFHGALLHLRGQTIGKAIVRTKIVNMTGKKPMLADLMVRRFALTLGLPMIPVVGQYLWYLDCLFIFRKDHRCLHDWVAGTRVVQTSPRVSAWRNQSSRSGSSIDPSAVQLSTIIFQYLRLDPKQIPPTARWIEDLQIPASDLRASHSAVAAAFPTKNPRILIGLPTFGALLGFLQIHRQSILQVPENRID